MLHKRILAVMLVWAGTVAWAATDTVLILHTNDFHDHIRAGYEGVGGMPYVSGYIKSIKAERPDTLLLDAGDVMEKGDMLADATKGAMMYEAMGRIGYQAGVVGNHDYDQGVAAICKNAALAPGYTLVCANWPEAAEVCMAPSKLFDVDGVKVGVIGLMRPQGDDKPGNKELAGMLSREAAALEPEAHLIVAVCHLSSGDCASLSRLAPEVDVFVSGHSHEVLQQPKIVAETGARIVQAGQYARYVGRLELTIDLDTEKVEEAKGELVEMRHDAVPCDTEMLSWVQQREQELCPEATRIVARTEKGMNNTDIARLAAAALLEKAGAEIAFCHPGVVIRSGLPVGAVDVNALFLTGGQRGRSVVTVPLTGAQIEEYFTRLVAEGWGRTQWVGFGAEYAVASAPGKAGVRTDLDAARVYRVVLPELEWTSRCLKVFGERARDAAAGEAPKTTPCDFTFIEALTAYVENLGAAGTPLETANKTLTAAQGLK